MSKIEKLQLFDAEIGRIEDNIVKLVRHRAQMQKKRNALSPVVNMPPEILAYIFELACMPDDPPFGQPPVVPLFFGGICSAWREVAWAASQLWSTIFIRICDRRPDVQARLLHDWINRSAQRPLTIKVVEDEMDDNDDDWGIDVTSTAVISVLAAHSHRWKNVDIFLPFSWKDVLSRIRGHVPLLSRLTLRVAENSPTMAAVDCFHWAPHLREVTLVGYSLSNVELPWTQLERLVGEYFPVGECLETLRLCPNLRRCQFEQHYQGVAPFPTLPIYHANLKAFELIVDTTFELSPVFGCLTLPALEEFVLSLPDDAPLLQFVIPLILRSACPLRILHLVGVTPPEEEILRCLHALPSLTTLLIINPVTNSGEKLTERFLAALHPSTEGWRFSPTLANPDSQSLTATRGPLVPNLQVFEYRGIIEFHSHTLVKLLVSRWYAGLSNATSGAFATGGESGTCYDSANVGCHRARPTVARLTSVILTTPREINLRTEQAMVLNSLVREGMKIEFQTDPENM